MVRIVKNNQNILFLILGHCNLKHILTKCMTFIRIKYY